MDRTVERMLKAHPEPPFAAPGTLSDCIKACVECAEVCTQCADACVAEHTELLEHCIRLDLDCADICAATARILSRQSEPDLAVVAQAISLCETVCRACSTECARHAPWHAHCQICAGACLDAARGCQNLLASAAAISGVTH
jgi:hypothetical protein